jgi:hypothetical protein
MSDVGSEVPRAAEALYGLPPERFVAERNQLARALAAKGDPDAAAVRKLARPSQLASALNRLSRARPERIRALLDAGARLRKGQRRALSGGGAEELRAAETAVRDAARALRNEATAALAEDGGKPPPASLLAGLELALRVAATGTEPDREALRRGVLTKEPERSGFGELTGLAAVSGAARAERGTGEREDGKAGKAERRKARRGEAERERGTAERGKSAEREGQRAERERARAERAARVEQEAQERADARARQRAAAQARKDLAAGETELRRRVRELEAADRRAAEARERRDEAERAVAEARTRLQGLEA